MPLWIECKLNGQTIGLCNVANISWPYDADAEYADYQVVTNESSGPLNATTVTHIRRKPYDVWRFVRDVLDAAIPEDIGVCRAVRRLRIERYKEKRARLAE